MNPGDKDERQKVIAALLEVCSADVTASLCSLGIVYKGNLTSNRTPFCVWGGFCVWKQIRLIRFECFPSHGVQEPFEILQAPCLNYLDLLRSLISCSTWLGWYLDRHDWWGIGAAGHLWRFTFWHPGRHKDTICPVSRGLFVVLFPHAEQLKETQF